MSRRLISSTSAAPSGDCAVPIQVIGGSAAPAIPSACASSGSSEDTLDALGANGILGVGLFRQDCGSGCTVTGSSNPGFYYTCPASGCRSTAEALTQQLQNPVWLFPTDNNGVVIQLPSVPAGGSVTVSGSLILGVGTVTNNVLGSTTKSYDLDPYGNFYTAFGGSTSSAFLDSGSNGLFFYSNLTVCSSGFYCPSSTRNYAATNSGYSNGVSATVSFSVANANTLFASNNGNSTAFSNLGGGGILGSFDWGLPFYYGRSVYTVFQQANGTGAYVGY